MESIFSETFDDGYHSQLSKIKTSASVKQIDKFKEAAREIGSDESVEAFERNLKRIAKAPRSEQVDHGKDNRGKVKPGVDDASDDE